VEFKLEDARGDFDLKASIFAIEPQADESTKTIKVRARFTAGNTIHPGVFVMVNIQLNANANAFMLPTQCVVPTLKGQKLFVYKNGAAKETPVHIGIRNEETIQILDGVTEGDTVLTTGLLGIKKDSKIKLLKASR
jgi:membrane fusion protein (multidrug efflux system)